MYPSRWFSLLVLLVLWSAAWKGVALWKAGRNNQLNWFIAMFILNTAGILPIVYLVWFQAKTTQMKAPASKR